MVEIIEQLSEPIRLFAGNDIVIGDIIALSYDNDTVSCKLSNSRNAFGMVIGRHDRWGMVPILYNMAIVRVDNYDTSEKYEVGDFLYSSDEGQLTNKKCKDDSILLGRVLDPPSAENPIMEINWI